jgi:GDP-L-fucose synthase
LLQLFKVEKMLPSDKIFIAGHRGMVGSACVRRFQAAGYNNLLLRSRAQLDLRNKSAVDDFFATEKPDYVILAAARVGGILANNTYPAEFLTENLEIQNNVIWAAYRSGVKKLCFLGSSCIYPRESPQPICEDYLLTGPLEPTNEGYAIAKIAGLKLCAYLRRQYSFPAFSLMPCNLYGTNDNYHPEHSHVFPALIRKFCTAADQHLPEVTLWGTGNPWREFMHVDDLANAVFYFISQTELPPELINTGAGTEITIRTLAETIAQEADFHGNITWDTTKPDGMFRKLLDSSLAKSLGWTPKISLSDGIRQTIREFRAL